MFISRSLEYTLAMGVKMRNNKNDLGPLQQQVLDFAWEHEGCTVRQCLDEMVPSEDKKYAYTTIQTVFDMLHKKGLVSRRRRKNAYCYTAKKTRTAMLAERVKDLIGRFGRAPEPIASSLVDALEGDAEEIQALVAELKSRGHIK